MASRPSDQIAIGGRLRAARKRAGKTLKDLAAVLNVEPNTYSRYESGSIRMSVGDLRKAAQYLGVTVGMLTGEEGGPWEKFVLVPIWTGSFSAGGGIPMTEETLAYRPEPWEVGHDFAGVHVVGDCMEPRVYRGEWAIVNVTMTARPGDIVAVLHNGDAFIRQLKTTADGGLELVAERGEPPIRVTPETRFLGVVRWAMRRP